MKYTGIRMLTILLISGALATVGCGKGEEAKNGGESSSAPAVALNGSPAQNMISVMEMGVNALKNNSESPAAAAAELNSIMSAYSIADIREASRAAKEAGQGATEEEKGRFKALQTEYKSLATTVGGKDPAAFNGAHGEWSKLWGLN
jgi:hypothetical protein